jgi:general stress protein 26
MRAFTLPNTMETIMAHKTLAELSEKMRDIDFTMLTTKTTGGAIAARPMSNNRDVEYDGDSWYFTYEDTLMVSDISADPNVGLSFQARSGIVGQRPFFLAVEGVADLVRDRSQFEAHWTKDLDRWFPDGIDTPGIVMIHVRAGRVHYWDGQDEGEIAL